jgi:hypothetical protein
MKAKRCATAGPGLARTTMAQFFAPQHYRALSNRGPLSYPSIWESLRGKHPGRYGEKRRQSGTGVLRRKSVGGRCQRKAGITCPVGRTFASCRSAGPSGWSLFHEPRDHFHGCRDRRPYHRCAAPSRRQGRTRRQAARLVHRHRAHAARPRDRPLDGVNPQDLCRKRQAGLLSQPRIPDRPLAA